MALPNFVPTIISDDRFCLPFIIIQIGGLYLKDGFQQWVFDSDEIGLSS